MDDTASNKRPGSDARNEVIEDIIARLEALEDIHATPVGNTPENEEVEMLLPRVSEDRYDRGGSESKSRGVDWSDLGERQPRRSGYCFDERHHGEPCPQPCFACDEDCPIEGYVPTLAEKQILLIVRSAFGHSE